MLSSVFSWQSDKSFSEGNEKNLKESFFLNKRKIWEELFSPFPPDLNMDLTSSATTAIRNLHIYTSEGKGSQYNYPATVSYLTVSAQVSGGKESHNVLSFLIFLCLWG